MAKPAPGHEPRTGRPTVEPVRVLVFPGGTESGLEIWRSLRWRRDLQLYSAGAPVSSHAPYVFARHRTVPPVSDPRWRPALARVVRRDRIDLIYPAHDDVTVALARSASGIPARVVMSPLRTCLVCRSKRATYAALKGAVRVPRTYAPTRVARYPVFVKPDRGQGSQDTHLVRDPEELARLTAGDRDRYVVSEYLPGAEYTVDCFTDRRGVLQYVGGRRRVRVRNGIAVDTVAETDPVFARIARRIGSRLRFRGAWFFQLKRDARGRLALLEVAPRVAGSMAMDRVLGANLPLLSVFDALDRDVRVLTNEFPVRMDRALTNRFVHPLKFRRAYVDLDDTLIVRGRPNPEVLRFLYDSKARGVRLILVTRHAGSVAATLRRHRLSEIFDEIRPVPVGASKAEVIEARRGAIFVDDSFAERSDVARRTGLPTFDCGMIELLLDDRV
ncbi:MAG TPA: ATP-grasp domain-containing protein [Thermoplasmata archaeon]|nr:ATP-grasp domain-containing protein [Thermoplasmata archaeon]